MAVSMPSVKLENTDCFKVQFTPTGGVASYVYVPQLSNSINEDATFYKEDFEKFATGVSVFYHQIQGSAPVDVKIK